MTYSINDFTFETEFMHGERKTFAANADGIVTDGKFSFRAILSQSGNTCTVKIPFSGINDADEKIRYIAVRYRPMKACAGKGGYILLPRQSGTVIKYTADKEPTEFVLLAIYNAHWTGGTMPAFGQITENAAYSCIITSGQYDAFVGYDINIGENGEYSSYPVFRFREYEDEPCSHEDLTVRFIVDEGTHTYVKTAHNYRDYLLNECGVTTLAERIKKSPNLDYSLDAMQVRLRLGWKPAPSPVEYQTVENEPPMKVAMTFNKVKELIDTFRKVGIDKAEFVLIGWNIKGHDGRWPQAFPVEESLGGEEKLRELIAYAKENGYSIAAHDNYTDAYTIADTWDEKDITTLHDGSIMKKAVWSGGRAHFLCSKVAYEKYFKPNIEKMRKVGFDGLHYSDVLTILAPEPCYCPEHRITRRESAHYRNLILHDIKEIMGGVSSEALLDFASPYLDRGLYMEQGEKQLLETPFTDDTVPFMPLVYHGIMSYNLSNATVNYAFKDESLSLRCAEYGATPLVYYYSAFMSSPELNWMGTLDARCDTPEEMLESALKVKRMYDDFEKMRKLKTTLMENHIRRDGYSITEYENGAKVVTNRSGHDIELFGQIIEDGKISVIE